VDSATMANRSGKGDTGTGMTTGMIDVSPDQAGGS
jgi:hypothetical protein